jgi:uncharacterized protein YjbJ (UPF0337 family)
MKPGIQDEVEGEFHDLKGKVKEQAGKLTKNPDWKPKGRRKK